MLITDRLERNITEVSKGTFEIILLTILDSRDWTWADSSHWDRDDGDNELGRIMSFTIPYIFPQEQRFEIQVIQKEIAKPDWDELSIYREDF
jgi:hypothetical protein